MEKYSNNDYKVRCTRYLNVEYMEAVKKYKLAVNSLENWSREEDPYIYKLCSECSENLYKAVEHFIREAINDPSLDEKDLTLKNLCEKLLEDERFENIEFSVFVTKKEPRNTSTHKGRLIEFSDYYRIFVNLQRLIKIVYPEAVVGNLDLCELNFDYNKFRFKCEDFDAENCHYILVTDPINDVEQQVIDKLMSLPWSMVVDFDGKGTKGKIGKNVLNKDNAQICDLEHVKKQGINEVTFKLKEIVYIAMENRATPRKAVQWDRRHKENFEFWIEKSNTLEKNKAIIVLAKTYDQSIKIFLEKIIDVYGTENVRIIFLENAFTNEQKEELDEIYSDYELFESPSLLYSINTIASHITIKEDERISKCIDGSLLPGYDKEVVVEDKALIDNMLQYFEILDLNKGKDVSNAYSEEEFLKGEIVSWEALKLGYDVLPVEKEIYNKFIEEIRINLKTVQSEVRIFYLLHKPGFGGTTLARRIAWDFHTEFPTLILNKYNVAETWGLLTAFYENVRKGIFIVADESEVAKEEIEELEKEAKNSVFPIAVLRVSRIGSFTNIRRKDERKQKELYLNVISNECSDKLKMKCKSLAIKKFEKQEVERREDKLKKIEQEELCPLIIGLFFLEELFEGTKDYIKRFVKEINDETSASNIKKAMIIISMCDYFGQKSVYPAILEEVVNPSHVLDFSISTYMKSVKPLFIFKKNNGAIYVKSRHYLLSKEIMAQLLIEEGESTNWKDYIAEYSMFFVDKTIEVCNQKIVPDLQVLLKDMFIENRDKEYLQGKFSVLIESCSTDEAKEKILVYLAEKYDQYINEEIDIEKSEYNEYQLLAHIWGHLARFYSSKGTMNNPSKAEDCSRKALNYSEKIGYYDYIILHIAGDTTSKRMQIVLDPINTIDDLKLDILDLVEGITEADDYFEKSIIYGNEEYGKVGQLTIWVKFLIKLFSFTNTTSVFNNVALENICSKLCRPDIHVWIQDGITKVIELLEYTNYENYSDTAQSIIYNLKTDFAPMLREKSSNVVGELNNYLGKLNAAPVKDSRKVANVKRMIVRNILSRYANEKTVLYETFESKDKKIRNDLSIVMNHLTDNINQEWQNNFDYVLWFNLAKYSDVSLDEAINCANRWLDYLKTQEIVDPRPYYYLYVLYYLRTLQGYTNSMHEAEKYIKACKKACEEKKKKNTTVNFSKVRDWFGNGKGLSCLVEDRIMDYSEMVNDERVRKVKGEFIEIDPSNRRVYGFISITEPVYLKGVKVFFKPLDCGVSSKQIGHIFEFKFGFSFERLVAFDKSIKDITVENKGKMISQKKNIVEREVSIGDKVHLDVKRYQREKKRLVGIIRENGKKGFLSQGEISYDRYISEADMEEYVSQEEVEVQVIYYNEEYDFYGVSIRKLLLGADDVGHKGAMYNLLKDIKID